MSEWVSIFPSTALRRRRAQTVRDSSSSYKIDYVIVIQNLFFKSWLASKSHQWFKVLVISLKGGFCLLVELHRGGSAPTACAAGLFKELVPYFSNGFPWSQRWKYPTAGAFVINFPIMTFARRLEQGNEYAPYSNVFNRPGVFYKQRSAVIKLFTE